MQEVQHRTAVFADPAKRQAKQAREQQDLQDFSLGERAHERLRDDVQEKLHRIHLLRRAGKSCQPLGVERARVGVESGARCKHIGHDEADEQRERGDDFEIDERLGPDSTDFLEVTHAGEADDHGREDDRCNQHLHQAHERIAQRPQLHAPLRSQGAEQAANHDADQDLYVERLD